MKKESYCCVRADGEGELLQVLLKKVTVIFKL